MGLFPTCEGDNWRLIKLVSELFGGQRKELGNKLGLTKFPFGMSQLVVACLLNIAEDAGEFDSSLSPFRQQTKFLSPPPHLSL